MCKYYVKFLQIHYMSQSHLNMHYNKVTSYNSESTYYVILS